jgi:site-specific recombinase XerD
VKAHKAVALLWISTALEEAEIRGYTWHCNRYTFASRLVVAGVDLRTVAELLGHRTLQMVMSHSDLASEHEASAVDRLIPDGGPVVAKWATGKSAAREPKQTKTLTHLN